MTVVAVALAGKMFQQSADGALNFDRGATINPLTGAPVASWYSPGQTYDSVFGSMSSALEECRAECTGIFMSTLPEVSQRSVSPGCCFTSPRWGVVVSLRHLASRAAQHTFTLPP